MHNQKTFNPADAYKLDDPQRPSYMPREEVVEALHLSSGMNIADIGAGTGYFALPFARAVTPAGRVFAVDLQRAMLNLLEAKLGEPDAPKNIELIEAAADWTSLSKGSCDRVFLGNVWHEFADHSAVLAEVGRVLRPAGTLAILDWRTGVSSPPGPPPDHRIAQSDAEATLKREGWKIQQSALCGNYSYLIVASAPAR
jgi:ubiquinone/menaquinone biosynthesis C-methylase UbiE